MIKVLIVVSGLVIFVPDAPPNPQRMTALLVETKDAHGMPLHGMTLHVPALRQQLDFFSVRSWHINNGDFEAVFKVEMNGQATISLGAQKDFPHLSQLTANPDDATIKPDCLTGKCTDDSADKNKLVAAIVRFEGRWRTRPLLRCEKAWILPVDFDEKSQSEFRLADLTTVLTGQAQRPLATGLALETEIETLKDLSLVIHGSTQQLQLTDPTMCQAWLGVGVSSCVVLEVENWPEVPIDASCNVADPPSHCRVDKHFKMFYDLIVTPPKENERWLPYVAAGVVKCPNSPGAGQPPGIRCPPAFTCAKSPCKP